MNEFLPW